MPAKVANVAAGAKLTGRPPPGLFGVIYADPPWRTITWSGKGRDRCPDGQRLLTTNGYPTLMFDELAALPVVSQWAARDCRLFMWAIDSHLPQAIALGQAWGFKYSTVAFVWAKRTETGKAWKFGAGKATRKGCELCLLFRRGKLERQSASVRQLVITPVTGHSEKPAEIYGRIEKLVDGPYLEIFARPPHPPGWTVWGDGVSPQGLQEVAPDLWFRPPGLSVT